MKTVYIAFVLILSTTYFAFAQPVRGTVSPVKKVKIAEQIYARGDSYNALSWFESVYEDDPGNTTILNRIAELQYELRDYERAESWYGRLVRRDKDREYPLARFTYAKLLKINGNYEDATLEFETFIEKNEDPVYEKLAKNEILGIQLATTAKANETISAVNAGEDINSPSTEQAAYSFGNKLYYSSLRSDSVIVIDDPKKSHIYAKLYEASKRSDGTWKKGKALKGINKTGFHTTSVTITPDGKTMYFTRCVIEGKQLCRIFRADKKNGKFVDSKSVNLGEKRHSYKHPAVGQVDGKEVLFFVSNMSGGQGDWDIYYTEIEGDDNGKSINLGDDVNTVGSEQSPFFHEGTLYFSTNGLPTMGGYDVYETSWGEEGWSEPVNMGKSVNSRTDDMFFTLDADGYRGYVVSNRPGTISLKSETCCDDIYMLTFSDRIPYDASVSVVDSQTGEPLTGTKVELREVKPSEKLVGALQNDTGEYNFTMRGGKTYVLVTTKSGYEPNTSAEFTTAEAGDTKSVSKKISLKRTPPPQVTPTKPVPDPTPPVVIKTDPTPPTIIDRQPYIPPVVRTEPAPPPIRTPEEYIALYGFVLPRLDTIYFDYDRYRVRSHARLVLDDVAAKLKRFPQLVVEVASHTDSKGANDYNYRLSEKRTRAAIKYLTSKGVEEYRLVPTYYGEDAPVAPNIRGDGQDNPEGRRKNRRTEFRIIEGTDENGRIRIELPRSQPTGAITPASSTNTSIFGDVYIESQPIIQPQPVVTQPSITQPKPVNTPEVSVQLESPEIGTTTTLTFNKKFHDFGVVKAGETVSETFQFTNTGQHDLLIEFASGSCGCTVPAWSSDPISPGGTGEITVKFDSKDKTGVQDQEVNVIANTNPITTVLKIKATVE